MMVIFWTSWFVAMNMTPFVMTLHNRFHTAERMRETSCLCAKTVAAVSRLVHLSAGLFALHCGSGRLQTCCFSLFAFRLFLRLNQKPPFALGKFLAVVCSCYVRSVFYLTPLLPDSELIRTLFALHHMCTWSTAVWVGPVLCPISWVIHSVAGVFCAGHLKLQT